MLTIIFYFFIIVVIIQLCYYLGVFSKFSFAETQNTDENINDKVSVSVIVCAKNEAENVIKYIPLLIQQDYPDFEIILIDDASNDKTLEKFKLFESQYPDLIHIVEVKNNEAFWGNKKYALTLGIKVAKKEYLLFTDADCYPVSENWITAMCSQFTEEKTITLGYAAYEKTEKSFVNKIIRFETLFTAIQYFSWAKVGHPYMGVGRNLAYKKEEFFNVNGFINHIQVRSGDDDLFINQAANGSNTAIVYSPESFTCSKPKEKYKDWLAQKRISIATANYYKFFDKTQLAIFYSSQLLFFILAIILFSFRFHWIIVLSLLIIRYIAAWLVVGFSAVKLKEDDLKIWFPVAEIVLIFTQVKIFITNIFSKQHIWK